MSGTGGLTAIAGAAMLAAQLATPAAAQEAPRPYYGHGHMGDGHMWDGGWWMFLGPLWMIVVLGALVAVVVLVARWLGGPGPGGQHVGPPGRTPMDILKERFARGEIDREEFEERRKLLE